MIVVRTSTLRAAAWSLLGLTTLLACGDEVVRGDPPVTVDAAPSAAVVQRVGEEGGSVKTGSGSGVEIPAGALGADVDVSVEDDPTAPAPTAPGSAVGTAVTFGPEGQQFSVPVTVTLVVDPSRLPAGKSLADVVVLTAPRDSTDFVALATRVGDGNVVAADTMHFSTFVPFVPDAAAVVDDAGVADAAPDPSDADAPDATLLPDSSTAPDGSVPGDPDAGYIGALTPNDFRWPGYNQNPTGPGETLRLGLPNATLTLAGSKIVYLVYFEDGTAAIHSVNAFGIEPPAVHAAVAAGEFATSLTSDATGRIYWIQCASDAPPPPAPQACTLKRMSASQPGSTIDTLGATGVSNDTLTLLDGAAYFYGANHAAQRFDLATGVQTALASSTTMPPNLRSVQQDGSAYYFFALTEDYQATEMYRFDALTSAGSTGILLDGTATNDAVSWHVFGAQLYVQRRDMFEQNRSIVRHDLAAPEQGASSVFVGSHADGTLFRSEVVFREGSAYSIATRHPSGFSGAEPAPADRLARVDLPAGTLTPLRDVPSSMTVHSVDASYIYLLEAYGAPFTQTGASQATYRLARVPAP